MAKPKQVYVCQSCGTVSIKWQGKCPGCGEWNTMLEEKEEPIAATLRVESDNLPQSLSQVDLTPVERLITGMPELDGVLGGGLVPGSLVLLGGEPGIGKSTILLQMALSLSHAKGDVLYVSGEESAPQVKLRAERLGGSKSQLLLLAENNLELIIYHAKNLI
mgnify:FL=1